MTTQMRCMMVNTAAAAAVMAVLTLSGLWMGLRYYTSSGPAQVIHSVSFESQTIPVGGHLIEHFEVSRFMECQAVTHRFIINDASKVVEWSSIAPTLITSVGAHQRGTVNIRLPDDLGPGYYEYRAVTYNSCGTPSVVTSPDTPFTIVPRSGSAVNP